MAEVISRLMETGDSCYWELHECGDSNKLESNLGNLLLFPYSFHSPHSLCSCANALKYLKLCALWERLHHLDALFFQQYLSSFE
jgi:hypothetical protein